MKTAYRIGRGVLAGGAVTFLILFGAWHLLAFQIGRQTRRINENARRGIA